MVLMVLAGGAAGPGRMAASAYRARSRPPELLVAGMAIGASITAAAIAARRPAESGTDPER